MRVRFFLSLMITVAFLFSCGNSAPKNAPKDTVEVKKSENEEDLLLSVAAELIPNPRTQAEKDKNIIINYMMDQGIELQSTPTGLYYQIIEEGIGANAVWGDWVTVNYKGYTLDGQVFDSSYKKGKAMEFYIGNVIAGWNEGLELIRPEGKALLVVPSSLAYGEKGFRNIIPPNTVLAFEIELLKITKK